jgi:membrane-associated protease RseP (regulator of RpoE activity)
VIFLLGVIVFILILVVSVAWHELGHLLPAKLFKVPVSQYMVGFGPTIWSKKVGETEYGFKWILLGGYIRMTGMYSPSPSKRAAKSGWRANLADAAREATREEIAAGDEGPEGRAFYKLSAPRKAVVMLGGPTMNLILALVLLAFSGSVLGAYNTSTTVGVISQCMDSAGVTVSCDQGSEGPAKAAGVQTGDKMVAWNGQPIETWEDVLANIGPSAEGPSVLTVERDGRRLDLTVTPIRTKEGDASRAVIGVRPHLVLERQPVSAAPGVLWDQVKASAGLYASLPVSVWNTLVDLVQGNDRDFNSPLSMVGVARLSGQVGSAEYSADIPDPWRLRWSTWLQLGAAINIALWLFNLLPLLPLDGGHIANAVFEGVRRTGARLRHRPDPGPADSARLMPLTYLVVGLLILMTLILVIADVINPIRV